MRATVALLDVKEQRFDAERGCGSLLKARLHDSKLAYQNGLTLGVYLRCHDQIQLLADSSS